MPSPNAIKPYVAGGIYHVYNRGVEKRLVFLDEHDYRAFEFILKRALSPRLPRAGSGGWSARNFSTEIELLAYCLMRNHFHLLLKQMNSRIIISFMRSVMNAYMTYFNQRYSRVGTLWQGTYKGVYVGSDAQLMQVSAYIHRNPYSLGLSPKELEDYPYSSFSVYLGARPVDWINPIAVLGLFEGAPAYRDFVLQEVGPLEVRPLAKAG